MLPRLVVHYWPAYLDHLVGRGEQTRWRVDAVLQCPPAHCVAANAKAAPVNGAPNGVVAPLAEGTPVPVVWHGGVLPNVEKGTDGLEGGITTRGVMVIKGANGLEVRATDGGLRPPTPSSVEPSGIPTRPTDGTEPDAEVVGPTKELLPTEAQAPDAVPVVAVMPPPSNSEVGVDVAAELPPIPKDACGIESPMPEHVVILPIVAPIGDAPEVNGLTPGDASSVAPSGMRAGATGEPGPMPSGDVMPNGKRPGELAIPPTCAKAEPQPRKTAAVAAIAKRVITGSTIFCIGIRRAPT